jgi:hypothetical protein
MKYLFVGNLVDYDNAKLGGRSIPQNQALNFQLNFIDGLLANTKSEDVEIIALPLFGSFLFTKSKLIYKRSYDYYKKTRVHRPSFVNLPIIKLFFWLIFVLKIVRKTFRSNKDETLNVIFYSFENGFILYPLLLRYNENLALSMIITDLPRIINSKMKYSNQRGLRFNLYQRLYDNFNKYVYITQEINKFTSQSQNDYVVIDGFINTPNIKPHSIDSGTKTILYAGTLDLTYGISTIIDVAKLLHDENVEFLIFGYTKSKELISEMNNLPNVKFHGFYELAELKSYYENTDAFIIPRPLDLENNSYSNPSKLYEYLTYNKPIIINNLPSIPADLKSILLINKNNEDPVIGFYEIIKDLLEGKIKQKEAYDIINKRKPSNQIQRYLDLFEKF